MEVILRLRGRVASIKKKVNKAFSGGRDTAEEQREHGANPDRDVACFYLTKLFLDKKDGEKLISDYKSGKILTRDVKKRLADELIKFTKKFQSNLRKIKMEDVDKSILKND